MWPFKKKENETSVKKSIFNTFKDYLLPSPQDERWKFLKSNVFELENLEVRISVNGGSCLIWVNDELYNVPRPVRMIYGKMLTARYQAMADNEARRYLKTLENSEAAT
jgi:hypothetical protein